MKSIIALAAVPLLLACTATDDGNASSPSTIDTDEAAIENPDVAAQGPNLLRDQGGEPYARAPDPSRDLTDMIAGCPHMNPEVRPRGSNCHGIFAEQCGADRASAHLGKKLTPALRETIGSLSPTGDTRFIRPGDAVIEDLRQGRLNIALDEHDIIRSVDCY